MSALVPDIQSCESWYLVTPGGRSSIRITDGLVFEQDEVGQLILASKNSEYGILSFQKSASGLWLSVCNPGWRMQTEDGPVLGPVHVNQPISICWKDTRMHIRQDFSDRAGTDVYDILLEPSASQPVSPPVQFTLVTEVVREAKPGDQDTENTSSALPETRFDPAIPTLSNVAATGKLELESPSFVEIRLREPYLESTLIPSPGDSAGSAFITSRPLYLRQSRQVRPHSESRSRATAWFGYALMTLGMLLSTNAQTPELPYELLLAKRQPAPAPEETSKLLSAVDELLTDRQGLDPITLQFAVDAYHASGQHQVAQDLQTRKENADPRWPPASETANETKEGN